MKDKKKSIDLSKDKKKRCLSERQRAIIGCIIILFLILLGPLLGRKAIEYISPIIQERMIEIFEES
ncbi:Uncharacterised protein [Clostridioides difficile]|uniref:hypothetical protein n=1 Tax=Clostridioides difficile TaxID=1496 RepID=UPI0010251566|nr:hypothetical protein [Clostridioides difficile]VFF93607.1 Uncharacterised protein [Clostridioides difficile]VIG04181.1 Uncharacterised protein [Clostridioides difficile]HBF4772012.1 hypothetical protein [Clostridioides difficile]HBF5037941.1 hypothetical protein [Clostridioides difficile]HBF5410666.1 hypothetical protein [Clostridioides difficile]